MNYKQFALQQVRQLKELAEEHAIAEKVMNDIQQTEKDVEAFSVLIPLIGGFNAGKSSLLNQFLGEELLPTNLLPETAIATEVKYGTKREIVAYSKSGSTSVFAVEEIKEILPKDYTHIELYLPNENLKRLGSLTLVDMPGVDSSIEEHNQAILNYIKQGVYYIVVTDVNHGLKDSVLDFLQELDLYEINYSVVLSKADHRMPEEIENMKEHVKSIVDGLTGEDIFVGQVSTKQNDIRDFHNILENIDQEQLMELHTAPKTLYVMDRVIRELEIRINHLNSDTEEIDAKIQKLERTLVETNQQIGQEKTAIEHKFSQDTVNLVLDDVEEAIIDSMHQLVKAAKVDEENFTRALNKVIRPVLIKSVDINVQEVLKESALNISNKLENIEGTLKLLSGSFQENKDGFSSFLDKITNPKFRVALGGLAIVTSVVAPLIELVIFFLPDIIKLFSDQDQKIREQIENEIIPQVIDKLEPEITAALDEVKEDFIANMQEELEGQKEEVVTALTKAKADKEQALENGEEQANQIREAIKTVRELKINVEAGMKTIEYLG